MEWTKNMPNHIIEDPDFYTKPPATSEHIVHEAEAKEAKAESDAKPDEKAEAKAKDAKMLKDLEPEKESKDAAKEDKSEKDAEKAAKEAEGAEKDAAAAFVQLSDEW